MNYLLDTCVLSELIKPQPNQNVATWIEKIQECHLYISALTMGEIQKGISRLENSKKKQSLQIWLEQDLAARFSGRILSVDAEISLEWGNMQGQAIRSGTTLPVIDSLIAATAKCHNLTLVTRNLEDFKNLPINLNNPWL
ncbi:type II toxin-antitoxin system VapC family toxin [Methylomonas paludis]|uniref:Ribonuclease VapC n=1 Tax=Methylomonas paludis TaxID=1173101 RepID=A0A975MLK3_9GAMM|nr:type II toxin-antitoxin system VapC family toxin [Methylomonas paludis]QWF69795.1 type II toxin-antitoxin system VapC family toxin [Methylomonas paludis]